MSLRKFQKIIAQSKVNFSAFPTLIISLHNSFKKTTSIFNFKILLKDFCIAFFVDKV